MGGRWKKGLKEKINEKMLGGHKDNQAGQDTLDRQLVRTPPAGRTRR
jgi:hypothetical protein